MKTIAQLEQSLTATKQSLDTLLTATRDREPTDAERTQIDGLLAEAKNTGQQLTRARTDRGQLDAITGLLNGDGLTTAGPAEGRSSFAHQIARSPFGQFLASHKGKLVQAGPAWSTPELLLEGFGGGDRLQATTITEDPASGGALTIPQYIPGIVPLPTRKLVVADLFGQGIATSNSVTFMAESAITNAAHETAEGAAKPESAITFVATNEPVRKIATFLPLSEEITEDIAGFPTYLNSRLRDFVLIAEDDSLVNGDGIAPHLTGILHRPGLAAPVVLTTPQNNADAILQQIVAIETATRLTVSGIIMNPANYLPTYGLKTTQGAYLSGGPFEPLVTPTLWGVPVALSPVIAAGTALVGAFQTGAELRRRTPGVVIRASNSHQDFFIKNLIAIVAEERLALVVYRASAFGTVTGLL